ncbi:Uncharacterised protein [Mycobacteroides abscessus subsp. abscessus]|nr:Uncharacterised protein [Mycobacteroides abscessus subsp. abscessus]
MWLKVSSSPEIFVLATSSSRVCAPPAILVVLMSKSLARTPSESSLMSLSS